MVADLVIDDWHQSPKSISQLPKICAGEKLWPIVDNKVSRHTRSMTAFEQSTRHACPSITPEYCAKLVAKMAEGAAAIRSSEGCHRIAC